MADDTFGTLNVEITGDYSQLQTSLNDAAQAATDGAHQIETAAEGGFSQLAEALVGIGEALVVAEGLKEFGQEALTAYGTVQSVTIALTQLTGSVESANSAVEQIKELAATEPFAFPEIAPTIQKMVALGVSIEQLPGVMQTVADTAAATGNSFQTVASSIDRLALSGTAGARQLVSLGISASQLAEAMGVTAAEVKVAFQALDQSQRLDFLQVALEKFAGSAEAQAQGIAGAWQVFQNQFEEVMVGIGQAIAPVVIEIVHFGEVILTDVQAAISTFELLPAPVRDVAVAVGLLTVAIVPLAGAIGAAGLAVIGAEAAFGALKAALLSVGVISATTAAAETAVAAETVAVGAAATVAAVGLEATAAAGTGLVGMFGAVSAAATAMLAGALADVTAFGGAVAILATETIPAAGASLLTFATVDVAAVAAATGTLAAGALTALTAVLSPLAVAVLAAGAAFAGWELGTWAEHNVPGMDALDNKITAMIAHIPILQTLVSQLAGTQDQASLNAAKLAQLTATLNKALEDVGVTIEKGSMSSQQYANALLKAAAAHGLLGTAAITTAEHETALDAAYDKLTNTISDNNAKVTVAAAVLKTARDNLDGTKESVQALNLAQVEYDKAVLAATPHTKDWADTLAGVTDAANKAVEKEASLATALRNATGEFSAHHISVELFIDVYKRAQAAAAAMGDTLITVEGELAKLDQANASTQITFDVTSKVYQSLLDKLQSGLLTTEQQEAVTKDLGNTYTQLQGLAAKLGTTFYETTGAMLQLTTGASRQQVALEDVSKTYTALAGLGVATATQQEAVAASFKTVSDDAAKLGLSVQQVGAGLQFIATGANAANPQVQALAKSLTDAYSNGVQFVTVNGQMVPMLADITQGANGAASGVAKFGDELPSVTTSAKDAGVSIGQTGQETLKTGESFDVATVKVLGFVDAAHKAQAAAKALAGTSTDGIAGVTAQIIKMQTAAATGDNTLAKMTSSTQTMTVAIQDNGSKIISWTDSVNAGIAALDQMEHAYNKLQTSLEGTGGVPSISLAQMMDPRSPFSGALGGPEGIQSITTPGVYAGDAVSGPGVLQQYLDQMSQQAQTLLEEGYTAVSVGKAVAIAESTYSSTIDTSVLVQKSATAATQATTAAVTGLGTAVTATTAAVNDQMATADDAYGALNEALLAAGISYASLSDAQQRDITQNLQAAAAGGTTVSALNALATSLVSATTGVTSTATSIGALGSSATTAATAISTAGTTVSNAAVAVAATALAVIQAVAPANAQVGNISSSTGLNLGAVAQSPGAAGSNAMVGTITPGTGQVVPYNNSAPLNLTVNLNGGMVVGSGGMQQLTQMVQQSVVTTLRQAGAKV